MKNSKPYVSRIVNCVIQTRKDSEDVLFYGQENGTMIVNLNGYAIIPLEEYKKLTKPSFLKRVKKFLSALTK